MLSSAEVLAPRPPPRRRPALRAVVTVVVLGLVAWGVIARVSADGEQEPAAATPPPAGSTPSRVVPTGPPPWVRYPTPLEGRWVSTSGTGRATLVIHNAYLDLWQGTGQRQGLPLTHHVMVVVGDRVHVRTPGDPGAVATYHWRIEGERLTFELVDRAPRSLSMLAGLTFDRS